MSRVRVLTVHAGLLIRVALHGLTGARATGGSAGRQKAPQTLSSVRGLGVAVAELAEPGEWRTALSWAQVADSCTHTWPRGFSAGLRARAGMRRLS